jgi:hypothetical protein
MPARPCRRERLQCHHRAILSADLWSDDVPVPTFRPRMVAPFWLGSRALLKGGLRGICPNRTLGRSGELLDVIEAPAQRGEPSFASLYCNCFC